MYRNSNSVFTQKMLPVGKSPIYNSILNEYQNNDTSSKLVMKYTTNPTSRQQFIARYDIFILYRYEINNQKG